MNRSEQPGSTRGCGFRRRRGLLLASALCLLASSCGPQKQELIAFIPQTDGMMLWDSAHAGAETAASRTGSSVAWRSTPIYIILLMERNVYMVIREHEREALRARRRARRAFIWREGVRKFGVPLAFVASLSTVLRDQGLSLTSVLRVDSIVEIAVGTCAGALVGGYLAGILMWVMFSRNQTSDDQ